MMKLTTLAMASEPQAPTPARDDFDSIDQPRFDQDRAGD